MPHEHVEQLGGAGREPATGIPAEQVQPGPHVPVGRAGSAIAAACGPGSNPAGGATQASQPAMVSARWCGIVPDARCSAAGPGIRWASLSDPSDPTCRVRCPSATFDQRVNSLPA